MGLDLASLRAATLQLEEALNLCDSEPYRSDRLMQRHLRAAAIKAFEFTYEISLKMLKRHLETISPTPGEVDRMTFSSLVREALGLDLVRSDVVVWRGYRKMRGTTSHIYDEEKAQEIFADVPDFLQEARYVLARLQERNRPHG